MNKNLFTILISGFMALSLVSCLNIDDDDTTSQTLTRNDRTIWVNAAAGNYTGRLVYFDENNKEDSISTTWTMRSDSTVTVNMPVKQLARFFTDTRVKDELLKAEPVKVNAMIHPYYSNTVGYYSYWFLPNPQEFTFSLEDEEGKSDELTFKFGSTYTYTSAGSNYIYYPVSIYNRTTMNISAYIIIDDVLLNGEKSGANTVFLLTGKKE